MPTTIWMITVGLANVPTDEVQPVPPVLFTTREAALHWLTTGMGPENPEVVFSDPIPVDLARLAADGEMDWFA